MATPGTLCFVIQSVDPYRFDFLNIFALPTGFEFRQRYDQRWVDPILRDGALAKLAGERVLVAFWDRATKRLVPVRFGQISEATPVGKVAYFRYDLGEFVRYAASPDARRAFLQQFNNDLHNHHGENKIDSTGALELCVFRLAVPLPESADATDLTQWGHALEEVASAECFASIEFLKIIGLREHNDAAASWASVADHSYKLKNNRTYQLRIMQFIPHANEALPPAPHDLDLHAFEDQIRVLRRRQRAVGKYDVLNFVFRTSGFLQGGETSVEIVPVEKEGDLSARNQPLHIPIRVAGPTPLAKLARLGVFAASLGVAIVPRLLGRSDTWITTVALVGLILSLVGVQQFLSVFEPFRTLRSGK